MKKISGPEIHLLTEKITNSYLNGLYVYDLEKEANTLINPCYTHLTGYTLQDIHSLSGGLFTLFHPEDQGRISRHVEAVTNAADDDVLEIEYRFKTVDGRWKWFFSRDTVLERGEDGKVLRLLGIFLDISDRKKVEESLDDSRLLLKVILENSLDAAYRRDLRAGRCDYMSPSIERITGFTLEERGAMTIEDMFQQIHPDDRHRTEQAIEGALKCGKGLLEYRFRAKSGSYRWLADTIRVLADSDGRPAYRIGNIRDVTERKENEERIERQKKELDATNERMLKEKARLEAVMEALPVGVAILDASGSVVRVNRAYKQVWGESVPTVRSIKDYSEFKAWRLHTGEPLPPEEWASARAVRKNQIITGQLLEIERFDGSHIPVINSAAPVYGPDREIIGSAVAIQDITGLREMEAALQESRFRLELLSKTANLLLVSTDPEGMVNEICQEVMVHLDCHLFFNFLVDENTGRLRLNACAGIPEEEARKLEWLDYGVAVCGCVERDKTPLIAQDILNTSDIRTDLVKSYGVQACACHPILSRGRLMGTLSFGSKSRSSFSSKDIDLMKTITDQVATAMERSRLIEQLRKSRDEMEARVQERTAELEVKNKELQDFTYIASHDLQEPLRKIVTFGDMLANCAGNSLDDESRDCIARMQKSAGMMRMLLDSLLRYSRLTTRPAPPEECHLETPIQAALYNLELTIREKKAVVEVGELPSVEADPIHMTQLFQNLIGNAIKFQHEDASPHVKIYSLPSEKNGPQKRMYRICVEDNGIGFDERHLDKIFSPFQRLHGKIKYQGVGMGLAICKKIVDRHGGKITAKSAVGKGTTFIIDLPERRQGQRCKMK